MLLHNRYEKVTKIGEGGYAVVYKAVDRKPKATTQKATQKYKLSMKKLQISENAENINTENVGSSLVTIEESKDKETMVALKKIRMIHTKDGVDFVSLREIKILQELSHPNIIKLLDVFYHKQNIYLVLELLVTDIEALIKNKNVVLTESHVKCIMHQVLEGIKYLHDNWVIHRDLKPNNMLMGTDGAIKFTDFGMARVFGSPNRELTHGVCTRWYRAPEVLFGSRFYGKALDMWSIGCIFAELLLREPLFRGETEIDQLSKIFSVLGTPAEENWPGVSSLPSFIPFTSTETVPLEMILTAASPECLALVKNLLQLDPKNRLTAQQALDHPFFQTGVKACNPSELATLI